MKHLKRMKRMLFFSFILLSALLLPLFSYSNASFSAFAISTDYPVQLMNIADKNNSNVLSENGTADGSTLSLKALGNDLSPSWRFDRVNQDSNGTFFKICSAESGRLLTPANYNVKAGTSVIMYGSESHQSQHWYIIPVKNDHLGNNLLYKIVNYSDTSLALTQGKAGVTLEKYTGADSQLWLLNSDGLQGFAGYCNDDGTGNVKAGNIGGIFGETIEVSTFDELKKYAESDTPYTIVVTSNIKVTDLNMNGTRYMCSAGRIYVRNNKTIIGSYNAHTLFNVQFCTATQKGIGNNVIIKNFEMQHDAESNNNDSIVCYFGSGENLWVDHVTFTGHKNHGYAPKTGQVDEDKFLACCYDADYCTVSDCSFGEHKYGLILGYPSDDENSKKNYDGFPRMTLLSNNFNGCETRGPGLMRWGYFHSFNNYVNNFSMAYTVHSGSDIYAENCYYENGGNVICDWNSITYEGAYAESGSKFSNCSRTVQGEGTASNPSYSMASKWRPFSNYDYKKLTADEAKTYCTSYSGCQSSNGKVKYIRFSKDGVPSAGFTSMPSGEMTTTTTTKQTTTTTTTTTAPIPAKLAEGAYRIKNADSGLYMQVADAKAENGANVQQWGSDGTGVHDIWKMFSAGDGYYYIASCVGDGGTYVLDVAGKKTDNGTNIDIYKYNSGANQQFMLTENSDGSYKIRTKVSGGKSAVEVINADKNSGANIQEWEVNGAACQNWIFEPVADSGCVMDENVVYTFENANSGMVMDIENGLMADNTNVRQWGSNGYNCQKWVLKSFGSGNYYWIRSAEDENYVLKADSNSGGANISITTYSTKDSSQLFRFTKNLDGTYSITTRASRDNCVIDIDSSSKENGANVQQRERNGNISQKWNIITEEKPTVKEVSGDVNNDGEYTVADIVLLQKWILAVKDTKLENWKAADLNNDNVLDSFDLVMMRKLLTEK